MQTLSIIVDVIVIIADLILITAILRRWKD